MAEDYNPTVAQLNDLSTLDTDWWAHPFNLLITPDGNLDPSVLSPLTDLANQLAD